MSVVRRGLFSACSQVSTDLCPYLALSHDVISQIPRFLPLNHNNHTQNIVIFGDLMQRKSQSLENLCMMGPFNWIYDLTKHLLKYFKGISVEIWLYGYFLRADKLLENKIIMNITQKQAIRCLIF